MTEINKFDLENFAIPRLKDWGFEVIRYDEEGIEIKPLIGHYNITDTIKMICSESGVNIKAYYLLENGNFKMCYRYKHELKEIGVI